MCWQAVLSWGWALYRGVNRRQWIANEWIVDISRNEKFIVDFPSHAYLPFRRCPAAAMYVEPANIRNSFLEATKITRSIRTVITMSR